MKIMRPTPDLLNQKEDGDGGRWVGGGVSNHYFYEPPGDSVPTSKISLPFQPCETKEIKVEEANERNARSILMETRARGGHRSGK